MNINLNTNADITAKLKAYGYSKAEPKKEAGTSAHLNGQRDQVILSMEGQEAPPKVQTLFINWKALL